ncbi:IclR family transcriptional regulator [Leisingera sp. SS27]|uniref:IclR family transcriptional regulator n=1 Tax=Leisingera sp. SS27 TaxID=2979462 RepID=UPI00232D53B2|nr:IclR family transcriptional regulator [Leisingera sp. SS27]MDC0660877.1 IclR family transcriptional regulator [Leisingera sp. SS27]
MNTFLLEQTLTGNDPTQDPRYLTSVERGFRVLDALSSSSNAMSLTELSRKTGLAVPTLQRLTATLVTAGYLEKESSSKRYRPTVKTVDLLFSYLSRNQFANRAWPHLVKLREELGLDVSLSVPLGGSMVYVHRLPGYSGNFENTLPGKKVPMHLSASGRCVLSFRSREHVETQLSAGGLEALTPWSLTDTEELMQQISLCREKGYALVQQEVTPGIMTLACPVLQGATAIAGVSIHLPSAGSNVSVFLDKALLPVVSVSQALSMG